MKVTVGLVNAKNAKPPSPKPSPKDFVWPSQRDADDKAAEKIAATLQELLPKRDWKHTDLARALYGGIGPNESPRNISAARRWVVAEHPIPNEETAGYIAEILGISLARLLEPEGKFDPTPPMIRPRKDSPRFSGKAKEKAKAKKAAPKEEKVKRPYVRRVPLEREAEKAVAAVNGKHKDDGAWILAIGLTPPDYKVASSPDHPGHDTMTITATLPHDRAMAILHILQHQAPEKAAE